MGESRDIPEEPRASAGPWVLFDGDCPICRRGVRTFRGMLRRRGVRFETLQSEAGRRFARGEDEMKVVTRKGEVIGGAEGIAYLSGFFGGRGQWDGCGGCECFGQRCGGCIDGWRGIGVVMAHVGWSIRDKALFLEINFSLNRSY